MPHTLDQYWSTLVLEGWACGNNLNPPSKKYIKWFSVANVSLDLASLDFKWSTIRHLTKKSKWFKDLKLKGVWLKGLWQNDIWQKKRLTKKHLPKRHLTKRHLTKRRLTKWHLTKRHLTKRHLIQRHLIQRRLTLRRLAQRRLIKRRLTESQLCSVARFCLFFAESESGKETINPTVQENDSLTVLADPGKKKSEELLGRNGTN